MHKMWRPIVRRLRLKLYTTAAAAAAGDGVLYRIERQATVYYVCYTCLELLLLLFFCFFESVLIVVTL